MRRRSPTHTLLAGVPLALAALAFAPCAQATPTLEEYRYFRALSIDLQGRMPTRAEVTAFEQPGFDTDVWIDTHLQGPAYAERLRRIYMDLMRLEVGTTFLFAPNQNVLRRYAVTGPAGQPINIYFRKGQRRARAATDGEFCLTQAETGLQFPNNSAATGTPIQVTQAALDANTVVVRPWWLYRDYTSATPSQRYDATTWAQMFPGFQPVAGLLTEPDGSTPTTEVRICREESQAAPMGTVFTSGRTMGVPAGTPPPYGRLSQLPVDTAYARNHHGEAISCLSGTSFQFSADCGCGAGLERCLPGASPGLEPPAFQIPTTAPLGVTQPLDNTAQSEGGWSRFWWSQEAQHFLDYVFSEDRDFREVLTARYSFVNGPLAQFYKYVAPSTCCTNALSFNYVQPIALFDPAALPTSLTVHDVSTWTEVPDRGPQSSGLITMPIFLTKYGTRRARAHVMYNAFLCRDFVAGNVQLMPSTEPNLMIRPGCATCHATLEPLAAYFSRIVESGWNFLPPTSFPLNDMACVPNAMGVMSTACTTFYDPAFSNSHQVLLRGAYGSMGHADAGPSGIAQAFTSDPAFPQCVAHNIAESFLGRAATDDDADLLTSLTTAFQSGGMHPRALVRAMVHADAYRHANNLSSTAWRQGGAR